MAENEERNLTHPVWDVYDSLRTARLNVLYYEHKLHRAESALSWMQIILAAAVPSSAIAGFDIWDFGIGPYAWEIFVSISSLVAFIQPFLGLPKKVKQYSELIDGYKILYYDLQNVRQKVTQDKAYGNSHKKLFNAAQKRRKSLEVKETGIKLDKRLRDKCEDEVEKALPAKNFYLPPEEQL